MVSEIRLYIEGGGDSKETKASLRHGFSTFFQSLVEKARKKNIRWNITVCGGRDAAHKGFLSALEHHPKAFNVLLVDAEEAVALPPLQHLKKRDPSWCLSDVCEESCHLMVQMMEAWFLADRKALCDFYGSGFKESALPGNRNIEAISKNTIESTLKTATKNSAKGEYHKIQHGCKLLAKIDSQKVRALSSHCNQFFDTVCKKINPATEVCEICP